MLVTVCLAVSAGAQDGTLDTSFNDSGKVVTTIGSTAVANGVAVQSDGRIVAVGYTATGSNYDFALARYNSNGTMDTDFDVDGIMTTDLGSSYDFVNAIAIQSDGKIVVGGYFYNGTSEDFAVVRYNGDGTLDTGFDGDGKVLTELGGSDVASSVALQSDGKIVLAGHSEGKFSVVRYTNNGTLDTTFNDDGIVVMAGIGSNGDNLASVAIQSDGMIVLAGSAFTDTGDVFAVVRLTSNGELDTGFDGDGIVTTAIGSSANAYSVGIQIDGKIVVTGNSSPGSEVEVAVVRYDSSGTLDPAFDNDGIVTAAIGNLNDGAVFGVLQADGKIVASGTWTADSTKIMVLRFNNDGSLDGEFGSSGVAMTSSYSTDLNGNSVALQSDGKIIVAGSSSNNGFAVLRFNGSSGPLPVQMTGLIAECGVGSVELRWKTQSETDNSGWDVELRIVSREYGVGTTEEAGGNWKSIGFVEGSGTATSPKNYSFTFEGLSIGRYAFRLKQIDRSGAFSYSGEVEVEVGSTPRVFWLSQNYANPFNPTTTFEFTLPEDGKTSLRIFDLLGREVALLFDGEAVAGRLVRAELDASSFAAGVYFARLEFGGKQLHRKLSLVK